MRDDIFSIIEAFAKYHMVVNLCTNGILLNRASKHYVERCLLYYHKY